VAVVGSALAVHRRRAARSSRESGLGVARVTEAGQP